MENVNRHHCLYCRKDWCYDNEHKLFRRDPLFIPRLEIEPHVELHRTCPPVPDIGRFALKMVGLEYEKQDTTIASIDEFMDCVERIVLKRPNFNAIEKDIGYSAIEALYLQRNFLTEWIA
jgi:hypothetical protein